MNIPGFNAEASIYSKYILPVGAMLAGLGQGGQVVPSLLRLPDFGCECSQDGCICCHGNIGCAVCFSRSGRCVWVI